MSVSAYSVGDRVVVTGLAGAGKSTFSRALSAKTGLPLIHIEPQPESPFNGNKLRRKGVARTKFTALAE